jgi:hypothetical protein
MLVFLGGDQHASNLHVVAGQTTGLARSPNPLGCSRVCSGIGSHKIVSIMVTRLFTTSIGFKKVPADSTAVRIEPRKTCGGA